MSGEKTDIQADICKYIREEAERYIRGLLNKLRELQVNLKSGRTYIVGGGAVPVKKQLQDCGDLISSLNIIDDIKANALGYLTIYHNSDEA